MKFDIFQGKTKTCQSHITEMLKALESYFHPSNAGRWIVSIDKKKILILNYKLCINTKKKNWFPD